MNYLFDTNIVIYLLNNRLPQSALNKLSSVIAELSLITKIELLGYHKITMPQQQAIENFIVSSILHPITEDITDRSIIIRKHFNIKTPDAIIAATAMEHNLVLLTHNIKDFAKVTGLQIADPYLI